MLMRMNVPVPNVFDPDLLLVLVAIVNYQKNRAKIHFFLHTIKKGRTFARFFEK